MERGRWYNSVLLCLQPRGGNAEQNIIAAIQKLKGQEEGQVKILLVLDGLDLLLATTGATNLSICNLVGQLREVEP